MIGCNYYYDRQPNGRLSERLRGKKMAQYEVAFTFTKVETEIIEANSVEEAEEKWAAMGYDAELFFIRDKNGHEVVYD